VTARLALVDLAPVDLPDFGAPDARPELAIDLHDDVLPFSNIPAWLPPFIPDTSRTMTVA
jgi:hypothetical protein